MLLIPRLVHQNFMTHSRRNGMGWYARLFLVSFLFYGLWRFFNRRLSVRAFMFDGRPVFYSLLCWILRPQKQPTYQVHLYPGHWRKLGFQQKYRLFIIPLRGKVSTLPENSTKAAVSSTSFPFYFILLLFADCLKTMRNLIVVCKACDPSLLAFFLANKSTVQRYWAHG